MEEGKKKERNLHFIYVSIILGTIILCLLAAIFFKYESAWQYLSFVGVALSLVLAIIAILITLIDVAGQKQQVFNISKSSEEMKKIVEEQQDYLIKLKTSLDKQLDSMYKSKENFNKIDEYLNRVETNNTDLLNRIETEMAKVSDALRNSPVKLETENKSISVHNDDLSSNSKDDSYSLQMMGTLLNYQHYATVQTEEVLKSEQKEELLEKLSEGFKGIIKLKFKDNRIELYYNMLSVNPFRDTDLIKYRAKKITKEFVDEIHKK